MTRRTRSILCLLGIALLSTTGCRPDPGADDYDSQEVFHFDAGDPRPENYVEGPDPWVEGEPRLSIGLFYEGGASETVVVDDVTVHFYVYEGTFGLTPEGRGQREGLSVDRLVHAGTPWWGGGVHWDTPRDLSLYTTLHVSLRSSDAAFREVKLGMTSGAEGSAARAEAQVLASDFGWTNDGAWHDLAVPLTAFVDAGLDPTEVTVALVLGGGSGTSADSMLIDAVYFSAE